MEKVNFQKLNITIIGLGLIGGSYAMALKQLRPKNLWGIDIDKNILKEAEEKEIIDKGYLNSKYPLNNSDLIIICLYPNLIVKFIKDNIKNFKKGAIITDTGGIKDTFIKKIHSFLPYTLDFISGHPMCGKENKGLKYASKHIFTNSNYIITPTSKNKLQNIKLIETIAKNIGCKNVVKISPQKHDKIIAFTSQLPHIIAVSLVNSSNFDINLKLFTGGSFKDTSRVALINDKLWSELLMCNKKNILNQIELFEKNIKILKNAIINNDKNSLESNFKKSNYIKKQLL